MRLSDVAQIMPDTLMSKASYHHGDLKVSLLQAATAMLSEGGIEVLSLRKLADRVGVSRTAPYHHFKNKNELLCALAEQGFHHWQDTAIRIFEQPDKTLPQKYREFVSAYIQYAAENPELYDLMFGRVIWKNNAATKSLKDVAYPCFQKQIQLTRSWQEQGFMAANHDTLRLAQVTWGTLHGIAMLLIDGIFADASHIEEMCDVAVQLFVQSQINNK